jgi:hypothetical protein
MPRTMKTAASKQRAVPANEVLDRLTGPAVRKTSVEDLLNSIERHAILLRACAAADNSENPPDEDMRNETSFAMMDHAEGIFSDTRAIRRAFDEDAKQHFDRRPAYFIKAPDSERGKGGAR